MAVQLKVKKTNTLNLHILFCRLIYYNNTFLAIDMPSKSKREKLLKLMSSQIINFDHCFCFFHAKCNFYAFNAMLSCKEYDFQKVHLRADDLCGNHTISFLVKFLIWIVVANFPLQRVHAQAPVIYIKRN